MACDYNIETAFKHLEAYFHSAINTLGYPKAALFGFCLALVAYNFLAVVLAALRRVHGEEREWMKRCLSTIARTKSPRLTTA